MAYEPKFPYKKLKRSEDANGARTYETPFGPVFSVTTILSKTKDTTGLDEWRARVGEEKAQEIVDEAARLGTQMHNHLEAYLLGEQRPGGTNYIHQMARRMADRIIQEGLQHVSEVWGIEAPLYYPGLYAGSADLIGVYKGKPAVMDFKNSRKMKKREYIQDYFLQCAAYGVAHNEIYDTDINQSVIFMHDREGNFEIFSSEGKDFKRNVDEWHDRLHEFYWR